MGYQKNLISVFLFISAVLLISSCNIINPEEDIPAYVKIQKFNLTTSQSQGSSSNKISDVWINVDDNLHGIFELPVHFPLLLEGKHNLKIRAGIKNNGIGASRIIYPFYKIYEIDTIFDSNTILNISPTTTYKDETIFAWAEDFEYSGFTLMSTYKSDTSLLQVSNNVFEGNASGAIFLDSLHRTFECRTMDTVFLPKTGIPVFLEMDYKSNLIQASNNNNIFAVGVNIHKYTTVVQQTVIYLNATENWNKIYIDLTNICTSNQDALYYSVFIGAYLDNGFNNAEIYIDNLKLVHF